MSVVLLLKFWRSKKKLNWYRSIGYANINQNQGQWTKRLQGVIMKLQIIG